MDKRNFYKFAFILIIGIVALGIYAISFLGEKSDKESPDVENMFEFNNDDVDIAWDDDVSSENNTNEENEFNDKSDKVTEGGSNSSPNQSDNGSDEDAEDKEESNYKSVYEDRFGKEKVEKAESITKKVVTMWLEENDDLGEWEDKSTSSFLNYVEENLALSLDSVSREVDKAESFVVGDETENEMTFESRVSWYYKKDGELYDKHKQLFYVTFLMDEETPLVTELVEL